ncbi:hypothetical protein KK141_15610 [Dyella sp. LX-66]|uniref:VirK family protein n=1 Tax=unclassified Dyella TaxID=2634549 RepID=UPI001BE03958|nr:MULTISPECIES: VirK family protein [unclassified Dyella]MBT2118068.1 hypothetical protein [Dyella sp. LX-1]MBT2140975.1 hypothetical protein [Dyella sp. LX-66]
MTKTLLILLAAPLALLSHTARADSEARDWAAVTRALQQGKHVTLVTDFSQCHTPDGAAGPALVGGLPIASFQLAGPALVFSEYHPTVLSSTGVRIDEFVRYRAMADQTLAISVFQGPPGSEKPTQIGQYQCNIGQGAKFYVDRRSWLRDGVEQN